MKIERIGSELMAVQYERQKQDNSEIKKENKQKDYLDISLEGRKKLSELADKKLNESQSDNTTNDSSNKLDEIRLKIANGFYKTDEVKQKIADKLIEDIFDEPKE
ncbi:MAG: hypothetical protein DRP35_07435 [Candidatus Zixiibacteriota bacterium]|nr:MAG: hypothetical protein DRP35_07435 [candidate division Zixibacteria bacterium]